MAFKNGVWWGGLAQDSTTVVGAVAAASTGNITLISSVAGQAAYVYAYNFTGESTANISVRIMSGSTIEVWRVTLESASTGALAAGSLDRDSMNVTPPGYLFRTAAAAALTYEKGGSSVANALISYALSYWMQ